MPVSLIKKVDDGRIRLTQELRDRLFRPLPQDAVMSWVWTIAITVLGGVLRFAFLTRPRADDKLQIFDEVYYVHDSWTLLHNGYELNTTNDGPGFIVHPPVGKWCIAMGEALFGENPFGWRVAAAVAGTLAILLLIRIGRRMFRSTLLGCIAGLLLCLDGLELVQSRAALLDIFLMTFLLAAFGCLVLDRDHRRKTTLRAIENGRATVRRLPGRTLASVPWWRFAAGVFTGLALGVKWSAVYFIVGYVVLSLAWEIGVRRSAGVRRPIRDALLDETGWLAAFVGFVLLTYVASWTGWFVTSGGWDRNFYADGHGGHPLPPIINALYNLGQYHLQILHFHTTLDAKHPYQSWPWGWLLLDRPVAYAYSGKGFCGVGVTCSTETLALGTPTLWWAFLPAIAATVWQWIAGRDWRAAAVLVGVIAGIVPWFAFPNRTMFYFYALPALPFLILVLTVVLGRILGDQSATRERRTVGAIIVGTYVLIVAMTFAYFWPIYTSETITYAQWHARMWLDSWI
ncbi:phospholipid carrier-dependent glycosyltransferase [Fodinicola feengrottensis]|uniref:Polyprenol-phosphate-mannose--protein mannosyltransferase n=3 Tax=Fodinicola feengrottensis TaxID=435914 RepID=A0ABN2HIU4_9ACTN